jgi:hypothetical protein
MHNRSDIDETNKQKKKEKKVNMASCPTGPEEK